MKPLQRRTTAWPLAWLCVMVIVYASLYPFEDWRNQDIAPWSFVSAPWPQYQTLFDMGSNLLGYSPLGFWLSLAMLRSAKPHWAAVLLGFWGALGVVFGWAVANKELNTTRDVVTNFMVLLLCFFWYII